jgi:uncharacterized protein (DUF1800 family)
MRGMDDRARIARLHRRFGFGLTVGELDAALSRGLAVEVERLLTPDKHGLEVAPDPFAGLDLAFKLGSARKAGVDAGNAWLGRMVASPRRLEERLAWFWHGVLVSSLAKVKAADAMANQIRLFWTHGLGDLPTLLRAVTVDPAMLVYLDGKDSTGKSPNENFSRELLELFALGVGNYTEADVQAGARALTGWRVQVRAGGTAAFVPRSHDDAPQTYLGASGVHDVDSVIAAVTAQPACAMYIAGKLGRALLGPGLSAENTAQLASVFTSSGLKIDALVRTAVELHVADVDGGPIVMGPVPWLITAERATGARLGPTTRVNGLRAAGQVPFLAPSVAGWPGGQAWYGSATMVGRLNLALAVATATPPGSPALTAAKAGDWVALSRALGLPADFGATTVTGLSTVPDAFSRLALALVSPEFVEA